MMTTALLLTMLVQGAASAPQKPTTGYAPVNELKMYYEGNGPDEPGFGKRRHLPRPYGRGFIWIARRFIGFQPSATARTTSVFLPAATGNVPRSTAR